MSERYMLYGHDGQGNLKSQKTVVLPQEDRVLAQHKAMNDPNLFYTFAKDGKAEFSVGPVGWRSKFGERIPEYNPA